MRGNDFLLDQDADFFPAQVLVVRPTHDGEVVKKDTYICSVKGNGKVVNVNTPEPGHLYMRASAGEQLSKGQLLFSIYPKPVKRPLPEKPPAKKREPFPVWTAVFCVAAAFAALSAADHFGVGRLIQDGKKAISTYDLGQFTRVMDRVSTIAMTEKPYSEGAVVYDPDEPAPMLDVPGGKEIIGDLK